MPDSISDNEDLAERCEALAEKIEAFAGFTPPVRDKERVTDAVEQLHEALRMYEQSSFHSDMGLGYSEARWASHHKMRSTVDGLQDHFDGISYSDALNNAIESKRERDELLSELKALRDRYA